MPNALPRALAALTIAAIAAALSGCSGKDDDAAPERPGTLVTTATATRQDVPVVLQSVGRLESTASPLVAAEIDGRVLRLAVDEGARLAAGEVVAELDPTSPELELRAARAETGRIAALLANEERRVTRFRALAAKGSISREQLDDAEAQLAVLRAQGQTAEARLRIAEDQRARTAVRAPIAGTVQRRLVSVGDFVKRGTPVVELATSANLRALLPFPEPLAARLAPGLPVTLVSPLAPGRRATGVVTELRPAVGESSRAVWVIVELANPGDWRPDATVRAEIVAETHAGAVVVPAGSLVRRPAGEVVYAIADGRAVQRPVRTGERFDGLVEVLEGLSAGEAVALEGAAYLSDGAPVRLAGATP